MYGAGASVIFPSVGSPALNAPYPPFGDEQGGDVVAERRTGQSASRHLPKAGMGIWDGLVWGYSSKRSGLRRCVRSMACSISHCAIFASCPERRMSGTLHPLYSAGRV